MTFDKIDLSAAAHLLGDSFVFALIAYGILIVAALLLPETEGPRVVADA
jgi:hypothetical protein